MYRYIQKKFFVDHFISLSYATFDFSTYFIYCTEMFIKTKENTQ